MSEENWTKLKVICPNGLAWNTRIETDEGKVLSHVTSVKIELDASSGLSRVTLVLVGVPLEFNAEHLLKVSEQVYELDEKVTQKNIAQLNRERYKNGMTAE